jgi:hypothetical protein
LPYKATIRQSTKKGNRRDFLFETICTIFYISRSSVSHSSFHYTSAHSLNTIYISHGTSGVRRTLSFAPCTQTIITVFRNTVCEAIRLEQQFRQELCCNFSIILGGQGLKVQFVITLPKVPLPSPTLTFRTSPKPF